jgi:putative Mg2+ transporter-C (MgtC) family protein
MVDMQSIDVWQQVVVIINTALAAVLGSIIGWERDRAGKSAGPRTMALVGAASSAVVAIGAVLDVEADFGDPTRAMHAVITGIGFLGAGLIFTNRSGGTQGVTMGVAVGLGFQVAGLGLTLIILAILRSTQVLEAVPRRNE